MNKSKINLRFMIPSGICLILVLYFLITLAGSFFKKEEPDPAVYKVCTYSGKQTLEAVAKEDRTESIILKDFNYYGESLNLYFESYILDHTDILTMDGYDIVLIDMCTGEKTVVKGEAAIDAGINLGTLKAGFYSVYLQKDEKLSRVYFDNKLMEDTVFYTVTRENQRAKVQLLADSSLFNQPEATSDLLDHSYLYLRVDFEALPEVTTVYDIAITTAPSLTSNASAVGAKANGITEAKELYDIAEEVKAQLEAAGLKVIILKDSYGEQIQYYGSGGVLERAYQSKAKYMINLDMLGANSYSTPDVYCSALAEGRLASSILDSLAKTELNTLQLKKAGRTSKGFDDIYEIREAGGIVLGAAGYSASSGANAAFAQNNRYGIDTVLIVYINIDKAADVKKFTANKQAIAQATAEGVLNYLKTEK